MIISKYVTVCFVTYFCSETILVVKHFNRFIHAFLFLGAATQNFGCATTTKSGISTETENSFHPLTTAAKIWRQNGKEEITLPWKNICNNEKQQNLFSMRELMPKQRTILYSIHSSQAPTLFVPDLQVLGILTE